VTDANLVLGYLDPGYFLGGRMPLDRAAAERAIRRAVAGPLHLDPVAAAWGIHSVVNENMAAAARLHLIEHNRDPGTFSLVAFGGAGPAHAAAVGHLVGVREVIFPAGAGVASATGALVAPLAFAFARTHVTTLDRLDTAAVRGLYEEMEREARRTLAAAAVDAAAVRVRRSADLRFAGQYHELEVPLPAGAFADGWADDLCRAFLARYRETYGRELTGLPIEALNWKIVAEGGGARVTLAEEPAAAGDPAPALKGSRPVYFPRPQAGYVDCPVYDRYRLAPGMALAGPAILEEREATIVLRPGDGARVDGYRNVVVRLDEGPQARD
jgi:N-methylhydantoinase A/oxoprolinase/acetone carboxylase beta subunit